MTGLISLSAPARDLITLWAVIVCFGSIICSVQSFMNRKPARMLLSALCFAPGYLSVRIRKLVLLYITERITAEECGGFAELPWISICAALLIPTVILALIWVSNNRFASGSITPASVKYFMDEMPCGIGYFRHDGQVLFSNRLINRLCISITGKPLINGNTLRDSLTDSAVIIDGRRWRFSVRELMLGSETIYEMTASDRTELYEAADALQEDNARLAQMNRELRAHNLAIDDIVRRQEVLQAKIDIHDEMNQLILSAAALEDDDIKELDRVYRLWQRNMSLLQMNTEEGAQPDEYRQLEEFARALGMVLNMNTPVPGALAAPQRELLFVAAREAIANAAKHAQSSRLDILFEESETEIRCCFRNDCPAAAEVRFTGGLKNLQDIARGCRAEISARADGAFRLYIIFAKDS